MESKIFPQSTRSKIKKRLASSAIFIMLGAFLAYEEPTIEIAMKPFHGKQFF